MSDRKATAMPMRRKDSDADEDVMSFASDDYAYKTSVPSQI